MAEQRWAVRPGTGALPAGGAGWGRRPTSGPKPAGGALERLPPHCPGTLLSPPRPPTFVRGATKVPFLSQETVVHLATEEDIFRHLGLTYLPPQLRNA